MGGEAMAQHMRRKSMENSRLPAVSGQQLPERLTGQAPTTGGDEQVPARTALQERIASGLQVISSSSYRRFANGNQALLVSFACSPHHAVIQVEIALAEPA